MQVKKHQWAPAEVGKRVHKQGNLSGIENPLKTAFCGNCKCVCVYVCVCVSLAWALNSSLE